MPLHIHFVNVGHGDCTIIEHPDGELTMIDINNAQDYDNETCSELRTERIVKLLSGETPDNSASITNPITFLKTYYSGRNLFRYIQSHADMDHMRGLRSLVNSGIGIENFWDTLHTKKPDDSWSLSDRWDWWQYEQLRTGKTNAKPFFLQAGAKGKYFNVDDYSGSGHNIIILNPTYVESISDDTNNLSYVLHLTHADKKIILGGDAEEKVWKKLHDTCGDLLKCDILKASHHGRDSGYYQPAVKAMNPSFTMVSVGKKPETDASNKYRSHTEGFVFSTRWMGNISVTIHDNGFINYGTTEEWKQSLTPTIPSALSRLAAL